MENVIKSATKNKVKYKHNKRSTKDSTIWHLMMIPGVLFTAIFAYLPMFGIVMAFQKFNPMKGFIKSPFVGFANFEYVFNLPGFYDALWNTLYISSLKIVFGLVVPLVLALLLNEITRNKFKKHVQTAIFVPYFLSWVILGGVIQTMFALDGPINQVLNLFGVESIMFLLDNKWFPIVLVITDVWKGMGYNMIVFLASITGIDQSLYEAASIDGANRWQCMTNITLPSMKPIIILLSVLSLGGLLNAGFDQVFMLYSPIVYESGDIIDTFVYRLGLLDRQYSPSAAVGLFKSVVTLILVSISYYTAYKVSDYRIF
ncbi:MAG: ABC transporter permease [Cellulosilyticaceae bacterium]